MGKVVIIFLFLIVAITTTILTGVNQRSEEIPKMLNGNFQDLGSYSLQYAINQVVTGQITEDAIVNYSGNNEFEVLDGRINSIKYEFATTTASGEYIDDSPSVEGEDTEGAVVYDITGTLNINPGTSDKNEFQMQITDGPLIDREYVHKNAPEYDYHGLASEVKVKPKALGRTLYVGSDSTPVELSPNARYTITADSMYVDLWNDHIHNGKAMGQWWITINAVNAILVLDPGIPLEDFVDDYTLFGGGDDSFSHVEVSITSNVSMDVQDQILTHDSSAGAIVIVSENAVGGWWYSVIEEDSNYKIIYWNP